MTRSFRSASATPWTAITISAFSYALSTGSRL